MSTRNTPEPQPEHPFAPFVRILGKGKSGSRSLSRTEARQAFTMILRGETEQLQLGAFLMLLRVKEETAEELAGFVEACRDTMLAPPVGLKADLDWSSYAGKKHQHPWYLLSMLLLAGAGYRVFVHGSAGHTAGRLYTQTALEALGFAAATNWSDVASQLDEDNFSYLPLDYFCPPLQDLMQLKPLLGLRSPVNTLTRMLNPLRADASLQSIFHPAYARLHQQADQLLAQPHAMVFKGESGEVEIKPQADTRAHCLSGELMTELTMTRSITGRVPAVAVPDTGAIRSLWRGEQENDYGRQATLATAAAGLLLLRPELDWQQAQQQAAQLWQQRDSQRLD